MAMTVGDFFWQRLWDWGVRRVFGYPGDGINGLLGALRRRGGDIDFVQVRHEEMAAFMAVPMPSSPERSASAWRLRVRGRHIF